MNLTKKQLDTIEHLAYLAFPPMRIAIVIEEDPYEFSMEIKDIQSDASRAYYKGWMQLQVEMREEMIKTAKNGSNSSLKELLDIMKVTNNLLSYE